MPWLAARPRRRTMMYRPAAGRVRACTPVPSGEASASLASSNARTTRTSDNGRSSGRISPVVGAMPRASRSITSLASTGFMSLRYVKVTLKSARVRCVGPAGYLSGLVYGGLARGRPKHVEYVDWRAAMFITIERRLGRQSHHPRLVELLWRVAIGCRMVRFLLVASPRNDCDNFIAV